MTDDDPPPEDFDYGERQDDGQYENYPVTDGEQFVQEIRRTYVHTECNVTTKMSRELAESVARDPSYYTKTFCVGCNEHVPVEEIEWEDGESWRVNE